MRLTGARTSLGPDESVDHAGLGFVATRMGDHVGDRRKWFRLPAVCSWIAPYCGQAASVTEPPATSTVNRTGPSGRTYSS
ncbi:hypothetical protein GCM10010530_21960 [Kribbella aluminosa]